MELCIIATSHMRDYETNWDGKRTKIMRLVYCCIYMRVAPSHNCQLLQQIAKLVTVEPKERTI